jgi:hypothetical protein
LLSSTSISFKSSFSTTLLPQTRSSITKYLEFETIIVVVKATNLEVGIVIKIGTSIEARTKIEAKA